MELIYWKILLQFLSVSIVILISVLDYIKIDKRTRKFKRFRYTLFSSLFLFLILNLLVVIYEERQKSAEEQTKKLEVAELKNQIKTLESQGNLANNLITGGDSFAYVELYPQENNSIDFRIQQKGKYPIYDVSVHIIDKDLLNSLNKKESNNDDFTTFNQSLIFGKDVGNFFVNGAKLLMNLKLMPNPESRKIEVLIGTRNGSFTESLRFKRINGKWLYAIRVIRENDKEVVYEKIPTDFPKNAQGQVDWD